MSQHNEIREDLVIRDAPAVQALGRINSAVGRVVGGLGGMISTLKSIAGIGTLFAIGEGLRSTDQLYQRVGRIKTVTGQSAADIHAMHDALELTGFAGERVEGVIIRMAKQMGRTGKAGSAMRAEWQRMGVDIHANATTQLLQLSKAAQEGKVGVGGLMKSFGVGRTDAAALLKSLQKGPEELRRIMKDTKAGADLVDDAALRSYEHMAQARRELADAWDEVVGKIYKKLIPAMTAFFKFVAEHMDALIASAGVYAALMAAGRVSNMLTGKGLGGNLSSAIGDAIGKATTLKGAKASTAVAELATSMKSGTWQQNLARAIAGGVKASQHSGPLSIGGQGGANFARGLADAVRTQQQMAKMSTAGQAFTGVIGRMSPGLGKLLASGSAMSTIVQVLARFGPYGLAIAAALLVIYKMIRMIADGTNPIARAVRQVFSEVWAKIQAIMQALKPVWDLFYKIFNFLLETQAKTLLFVLGVTLTMLNDILRLVITIGTVIHDLVTSPMWVARKGLSYVLKKAWDEADITTDLIKKKDVTPDGKPPPTYNDFRGSKFDVTQNFAEGFDPGRIAATFGDELVKLSDRKLQSGFAPIYSIPRGGGRL